MGSLLRLCGEMIAAVGVFAGGGTLSVSLQLSGACIAIMVISVLVFALCGRFTDVDRLRFGAMTSTSTAQARKLAFFGGNSHESLESRVIHAFISGVRSTA